MTAKYHFINHACFTIEKNNSTIIFDPFLDGNPEGLEAKDIKVIISGGITKLSYGTKYLHFFDQFYKSDLNYIKLK